MPSSESEEVAKFGRKRTLGFDEIYETEWNFGFRFVGTFSQVIIIRTAENDVKV